MDDRWDGQKYVDLRIVCCTSGSCPLEGSRCDGRVSWLYIGEPCGASEAVRLWCTTYSVRTSPACESDGRKWRNTCTVRDVRVQREGEWRQCVMTSEMINELTDGRRERQMWESGGKSSDWSRWNRLIAAGGGGGGSGAFLMDERWGIVDLQHHGVDHLLGYSSNSSPWTASSISARAARLDSRRTESRARESRAYRQKTRSVSQQNGVCDHDFTVFYRCCCWSWCMEATWGKNMLLVNHIESFCWQLIEIIEIILTFHLIFSFPWHNYDLVGHDRDLPPQFRVWVLWQLNGGHVYSVYRGFTASETRGLSV